MTETTDRTKGIWYLSKDGKMAFKINTSVENFEENREETGYGFEVVDRYNIENLGIKQIKEILDGYKENAEILSSLLTQYENKHGSNYDSSSLLSNRRTNRDNDGLDQEALSRESFRGRNTGDSGSYQGAGEIETSTTPQAFELTTPDGVKTVYGYYRHEQKAMYLDENIINLEHPAHLG